VLTGLAESCTKAVAEQVLEPVGKYQAFIAVLQRDAQDNRAVPNGYDLVMPSKL
jgi:hypothetical protein